MHRMHVYTREASASACFGNYQVVRPIAKGGSGIILLGQHLRSGLEVAIKVPHPQAENAVSMLHHEARMLVALNHPHIIRMHRSGIQNGKPFLALEYAPYGDLRAQYNSHSVLPLSTVVFFVKQISSALQYLHSRGVLHRDVKPENMLLLRPDYLVLADFGIAISEQVALLQKKRVGTIRYMAPEQLVGTPCHASDQYALATVIYEWLCGHPPFMGTSFEIMQQHLYTLPPSLQGAATTLPSEVNDVLQKALAKNSADRFLDIRTFCSALEVATTPSRLIIHNTSHTQKRYATRSITEGTRHPVKNRTSKMQKKQPSHMLNQLLYDQLLCLVANLVLGIVIADLYSWFITVMCSMTLLLLRLFRCSTAFTWSVMSTIMALSFVTVNYAHSALAVGIHYLLCLLIIAWLVASIKSPYRRS